MNQLQLDYQVAQHPSAFHQQQGNSHAYPSNQSQTAGRHHQAQSFASAGTYPGSTFDLSRPQGSSYNQNDGLLHQPTAAHLAGQQNTYTSAPYSQSVNATASPAQQQQALRHSASPLQGNSPYAQVQQLPISKQQTPPIKYPMAAPPLPRTPGNAQAGSTGTASPKTPLSPNTQSREQRRVELLMDINADLLQEINSLQAQGMGGATHPQHQAQLRAQNMPDKMATDDYVQCLRRVQANLSYLAPKMDPSMAQKAPPGPAHMTPPPHMATLRAKYDQLRELFPGWAGLDSRPAQATGSPSSNPTNSMNGTSQAGPATTVQS